MLVISTLHEPEKNNSSFYNAISLFLEILMQFGLTFLAGWPSNPQKAETKMSRSELKVTTQIELDKSHATFWTNWWTSAKMHPGMQITHQCDRWWSLRKWCVKVGQKEAGGKLSENIKFISSGNLSFSTFGLNSKIWIFLACYNHLLNFI